MFSLKCSKWAIFSKSLTIEIGLSTVFFTGCLADNYKVIISQRNPANPYMISILSCCICQSELSPLHTTHTAHDKRSLEVVGCYQLQQTALNLFPRAEANCIAHQVALHCTFLQYLPAKTDKFEAKTHLSCFRSHSHMVCAGYICL